MTVIDENKGLRSDQKTAIIEAGIRGIRQAVDPFNGDLNTALFETSSVTEAVKNAVLAELKKAARPVHLRDTRLAHPYRKIIISSDRGVHSRVLEMAKIFEIDAGRALLNADEAVKRTQDNGEALFVTIAPNHFGDVGERLPRVLAALDDKHSLIVHSHMNMVGNRRSLSGRTDAAYAMLMHQQKSPLLIISAQFGMMHGNHSVAEIQGSFIPETLDNTLPGLQFGLSASDVACMLITDADSFQSCEGPINIRCPGSLCRQYPEYENYPDSFVFRLDPHSNNTWCLDVEPKTNRNDESGVATGFVTRLTPL